MAAYAGLYMFVTIHPVFENKCWQYVRKKRHISPVTVEKYEVRLKCVKEI